jgi:glyceraldehyde 3-phosphate dehydrogenase
MIAINGFGRIGRNVFKIALAKGLEIAFINDLTDSKSLAHLLKYDSVQPTFQADISYDETGIIVNGKKYPVLAIKDPSQLPVKEYGVDMIIEGTGVFTDREKLNLHLQAGAKKVILTAPAKGEIDKTIVLGVNDDTLTAEDKLISNASCTTNCLAPLAYILEKEYGIKQGFMNTVHSYTNDQNLLDLPHKDLRRARAAAINIVPSSTGAAKALGLVVPSLSGKLDGLSLRVPTPDGSIVDLTVELNQDVSKDEINAVFKKYAQTAQFKGILEYNEDLIVSSDIIGNPHSCIFDSTLTQVIGEKSKLVKVFGWYDNEWGYSNRIVDLILKVSNL